MPSIGDVSTPASPINLPRIKDPRKNNLMKLLLVEMGIQVILAACMMRNRSKGFVRSFFLSHE